MSFRAAELLRGLSANRKGFRERFHYEAKLARALTTLGSEGTFSFLSFYFLMLIVCHPTVSHYPFFFL